MLRIAAILGATAVAIGAFGAHWLKPQLSEYQVQIFEKGVQYQFYHVLALLAAALGLRQKAGTGLVAPSWLAVRGWHRLFLRLFIPVGLPRTTAVLCVLGRASDPTWGTMFYCWLVGFGPWCEE